jgi:hypothetical protein
MKQKSFQLFIFAVVRVLIGGIVGIAIGSLLYGTLLPFWKISSIGQAPEGAVDILFVNYHYYGEIQGLNNTLYIQTLSRNVYFGLQDNWESLPLLPNGKPISQIWLRDNKGDAPIVAVADQGEFYQFINGQWEVLTDYTGPYGGTHPATCVDNWYLPAFGVADSAGTVFSHATESNSICYILFRDGRLQRWTRATDAFGLFGSLAIGALIGMVVGFNAMSIKMMISKLTGIIQKKLCRKDS